MGNAAPEERTYPKLEEPQPVGEGGEDQPKAVTLAPEVPQGQAHRGEAKKGRRRPRRDAPQAVNSNKVFASTSEELDRRQAHLLGLTAGKLALRCRDALETTVRPNIEPGPCRT